MVNYDLKNDLEAKQRGSNIILLKKRGVRSNFVLSGQEFGSPDIGQPLFG